MTKSLPFLYVLILVCTMSCRSMTPISKSSPDHQAISKVLFPTISVHSEISKSSKKIGEYDERNIIKIVVNGNKAIAYWNQDSNRQQQASSWKSTFIKEGDEIVISAMEHHSNIVPWQLLCEQTRARLRVIPINHEGELLFHEYENLLNERTKLVAVTHVSNALGSINPIKEIIDTAHRRDIPVLIDGAQAVPHMKIDVRDLGCDFYAFSGHKLFGPTGIGVLYGKTNLLDAMPPYQGGGDMISLVTFEKTHYNVLPYKFEA